MNVLHVVNNLSVKSGGQSAACFDLAYNLSKTSNSVGLLYGDCPGPCFTDEINPDSNLILFKFDCSNYFDFISKIMNAINSLKVEIIHLHGMWLPIYAIAFLLTKLNSLKIVISPHGTLSSWDLNKKKLKKVIALLLYQKAILNRVDLFLATSSSEASGIKALGLMQPIEIVPIGIQPPSDAILSMRTEVSCGIRVALFLGRIHPGKGILDLIDAWKLARRLSWRLIIAGAATTVEEIDYKKQLDKKIIEYNLTDDIEFLGMVSGEAKCELFQKTDLFILPTYSENFGIVVAEALSYGIPVITTTGAPWEDIEINKCGWWISPGSSSLVLALEEAMNMNSVELANMGLRGRKMVINKYSWDTTCEKLLSAYNSVI